MKDDSEPKVLFLPCKLIVQLYKLVMNKEPDTMADDDSHSLFS